MFTLSFVTLSGPPGVALAASAAAATAPAGAAHTGGHEVDGGGVVLHLVVAVQAYAALGQLVVHEHPCGHETAHANQLGIAHVDAPVSGGVVGAEAGTLAIMAGAEAVTLARVRPLLGVLGKRIVHIGPPGAGQVAKACNQMIMVTAIQACAEAVRLASAHGVDVAAVRQALMGGSAGSKVLEVMGAKMVERDFAAGIEARLHHKDFAILMDEAARLGAPLPVAAQVWQQLNALMGAGWGREDTSSLLRVLER